MSGHRKDVFDTGEMRDGHRLLRNVCDEDWRHNVRSIALGLEALRAVDRYGISRRGEQYAGFRAALASGAA